MNIPDFQFGEAISIPADWRRIIGGDCPIRRRPLDLEDTLQRWQETHGAHALLDLGLLQQDVDAVAPNGALRDDQVWLQPHVDPDSDEVVGISTAAGLLIAGGLSIARSLEIAVVHELRNEPVPRLFLTGDVHDLAVLSSLGYAARPVEFLLFEGSCELGELCEIFGWRDPAEITIQFDVDDQILLGLTDQRSLDAIDEELAGESLSLSLTESDYGGTDNFEIVLVGWSPAALTQDLPAPFLAIIENLKQLQAALGRDLSNVGIWRPDDAMLDRLRFGLNYGTAANVRSVLETSLRQDRWALDGFVPHPAEPPSLPQAFSEVEMQAAADSVTWQRAVAALHAAQARELIEPLFQDASNADPLHRFLQMNTAALQSLFLSQWCNLHRSMARADHSNFPTKDVALLLATSDRILRNVNAQEGAR